MDGTIVAVGHDDAGGDRNAAVWTSSDGRRWTRVSGTSLGTTGEQRMDAVATMGDDVVAVGSERIGGDVDAAVWRSADRGTSWDRVEGATSGLHEAGDQAMQVVVPAAPGVVAAGFDTSPERRPRRRGVDVEGRLQLEPADAGVPLGAGRPADLRRDDHG